MLLLRPSVLLAVLVAAVAPAAAAPAAATPPAAAAPADPLAPLDPLLGEWVADPATSGGAGGSTFERALGGKILVRRNHAELPAARDRPATTHDDLMVVFAEGPGLRADYFDSEGHVIHYDVAARAHELVFVSPPQAGAPRFQFTYVLNKPDVLGFTFAIAPPGSPEQWKPYLSGEVRRKK